MSIKKCWRCVECGDLVPCRCPHCEAVKPKPQTEAARRKATPIYTGVLKYFPDAIAAVARCSQAGNDQHHPDTPLHWDRAKSTDELDALARHLMDAGTRDSDGIRHSAKVAWRALANLQKEIEQDSGPDCTAGGPVPEGKIYIS